MSKKQIDGLFEMLKEGAEEEVKEGNFDSNPETLSNLIKFATRMIVNYNNNVNPKLNDAFIEDEKEENLYVNYLEVEGLQREVFMSNVPFSFIDISKRAFVEDLLRQYFPTSSIRIISLNVKDLKMVKQEDYK